MALLILLDERDDRGVTHRASNCARRDRTIGGSALLSSPVVLDAVTEEFEQLRLLAERRDLAKRQIRELVGHCGHRGGKDASLRRREMVRDEDGVHPCRNLL